MKRLLKFINDPVFKAVMVVNCLLVVSMLLFGLGLILR